MKKHKVFSDLCLCNDLKLQKVTKFQTFDEGTKTNKSNKP